MQAAPSGRIDLPYRHYTLVTADGLLVERTRKHPFGLSRALYSAADAPDAGRGGLVWAQPADGTCRRVCHPTQLPALRPLLRQRLA
jgi:hypothetical protein